MVNDIPHFYSYLIVLEMVAVGGYTYFVSNGQLHHVRDNYGHGYTDYGINFIITRSRIGIGAAIEPRSTRIYSFSYNKYGQ